MIFQRQLPTLVLLRGLLALVLAVSAIVVVDWRSGPIGLRSDGSLAALARAVAIAPKMDSWLPLKRGWDAAVAGRPDRIYAEGLYAGVSKLQYPPVSLLLVPIVEGLGVPPPVFFWLTGWLAFALTLAATLLIARDRLDRAGAAPSETARCLVCIGAMAFLFYPLVKSVSLGQVQTYMTAMLAWSLWLYLRGRTTMAGALIGFACWFKPHLVLLALWSLLAGRAGMATAVVGVGALGALVGIGFFGVGPHMDYVGVLSYIGQRGEAYYPNQSVNGLLNRLMSVSQPELYNNLEWRYTFPPSNAVVSVFSTASSVLLLALGGWHAATRMRGSTLSLAAAILCVTLASPIAWEHHHAVLFPIGVVLLSERREHGRGTAIAMTAAISIASLQLNFLNVTAASYLNIAQSYLFFASLTVLVICWRVGAVARQTSLRRTALSVPDGNSFVLRRGSAARARGPGG